jgi:hypothetical protein
VPELVVAHQFRPLHHAGSSSQAMVMVEGLKVVPQCIKKVEHQSIHWIPPFMRSVAMDNRESMA